MIKNLNKNVESELKDKRLENAVGGYILEKIYDNGYRGTEKFYKLIDDQRGTARGHNMRYLFSTLAEAEAAARALGLSTKSITKDGEAYLRGRYAAGLTPSATKG